MSLPLQRFPSPPPVHYPAIRSTLRSGDILICAGSGWFSKMIQRATGSVWSHVGFVMRLDAIDRIMVLESLEPVGVRTVPLSKYLHDYDSAGNPYPGGMAILRHAQFEDQVNPAELKKFGQFAVDLFGYPYDTQEIAKIAARIAASALPFSRDENKALERNREFICSEYVHECYRAVGIEIPPDGRGFIAPADFARVKELNLLHVLKRPDPRQVPSPRGPVLRRKRR